MGGDNMNYVKPIVVKSGLNLRWGYGNHRLFIDDIELHWAAYLLQHIEIITMFMLNVSVEKTEMLQGSHWRLVDLDETIKRRILSRKCRQSQNNLIGGASTQFHTLTERDIINEYNVGKSYPIVINSTGYHAMDQFENMLKEQNKNDEPDEPDCAQKEIARCYYEMCKSFITSGNLGKATVLLKKAILLDKYNFNYTRLAKELNFDRRGGVAVSSSVTGVIAPTLK
jgi:hypothetical protein